MTKKYLPSIENRELVRCSVSQLEKYNPNAYGGCPRKWAYNKLAGLEEPTTSAQQFGTEGHGRFDAFWRTGDFEELSDLERNALPFLPVGHKAYSEVNLSWLELEGVKFQGAIDLVHDRNVYDYKYQSRLKNIEPNAQVFGYLREVGLQFFPKEDKQKFTFICIEKKTGKVKPIEYEFAPNEVIRAWAGYAPLIREMKDIVRDGDVERVPCNTKSCFAYGPCPYLSICNRGQKKEEIMSFLDDLVEAKKASNTPVVTIPDVPELRALPPDAPPADVVPEPEALPQPKATAPARRRKAKEGVVSEPVARLKTLRFGLKIGMPEYSSVEACVEVEGTDEEAMTAKANEILMRRIEKLIPAYKEALTLRNGKK